MTKLEIKNIRSTVDDYDVYLFDLWGVIVEGGNLYPGVVDTINSIINKKRVFFISNAPRPVLSSFDILSSWGLNVSPDMIMTSGEVTLGLINASQEKLKITHPVIYHLGSDRNNHILGAFSGKITTNITEANILLITTYRDEGEDLQEFDELLKVAAQQNIISICANPDTIIPNLGKKRYCAGYFAKELQGLGGKVIYTGKPYPEIYQVVFNKISNIAKDRILMIGDTLETDILGAKNFGIDSALVMTGNAEKFHAAYSNPDDKLASLRRAAESAGAIPNFIVQLD